MTDCEDLSVLADMYQLNIKVTTKGPHDKKTSVTWIYPHADMKTFAELKNVELDDMTLLHENDNHFNLVVSQHSDLAVLGSLSYRFNVGPVLENEGNRIEKLTSFETEKKVEEEIELIAVKKEHMKCKKNENLIKKEYFKCERELKINTEEVEKLKTEIKDLKEITSLSKGLKEVIKTT